MIISNEKPVAMVSRSTSKTEQNYTQLDLEAMAVVYGLRCFTRIQLVRTERINLKHQDFLFYLLFEKGQNNSANYLSWHVNQWKSVSKSEREIKRS